MLMPEHVQGPAGASSPLDGDEPVVHKVLQSAPKVLCTPRHPTRVRGPKKQLSSAQARRELPLCLLSSALKLSCGSEPWKLASAQTRKRTAHDASSHQSASAC